MTQLMNEHTVTVRRTIVASAQELFDAWLDPESMALWMRPGRVTHTTATVDARVGGAFEIVMHTSDGPIYTRGVYRVIDPPRRLVFTWHESLVSVEFIEVEAATEIVVTHSGLPSDESATMHAQGWTAALVLLEKI